MRRLFIFLFDDRVVALLPCVIVSLYPDDVGLFFMLSSSGSAHFLQAVII